jgi:hypothetical protein
VFERVRSGSPLFFKLSNVTSQLVLLNSLNFDRDDFFLVFVDSQVNKRLEVERRILNIEVFFYEPLDLSPVSFKQFIAA